jgi:hypothetical protein
MGTSYQIQCVYLQLGIYYNHAYFQFRMVIDLLSAWSKVQILPGSFLDSGQLIFDTCTCVWCKYYRLAAGTRARIALTLLQIHSQLQNHRRHLLNSLAKN